MAWSDAARAAAAEARLRHKKGSPGQRREVAYLLRTARGMKRHKMRGARDLFASAKRRKIDFGIK